MPTRAEASPERPAPGPSGTSTVVTVIVPFFQKETGLLRRSVGSILGQSFRGDLRVVIVDDGSPVSGEEELAEIDAGRAELTIVRQQNAGPGAARNRGLEAVRNDSDYVAFMDSDDWWEPDYLELAVTTLNKGYDLFYANTRREGIEGDRFAWHEKTGLNLVPQDHEAIDAAEDTWAFVGDFFDYAIVRSNIMATSSTIFRRRIHPTLRFNTRLYNGQDRLFKLGIAQVAGRVAFTPRVLVHECRGLNIFDKAQWGSEQSLRFLRNYIKLAKVTLQELELSAAHRKAVKKQLSESRYSFFASVVHLLRHRTPIDYRELWSTLTDDPILIALFPVHACRLLRRKAMP